MNGILKKFSSSVNPNKTRHLKGIIIKRGGAATGESENAMLPINNPCKSTEVVYLSYFLTLMSVTRYSYIGS